MTVKNPAPPELVALGQELAAMGLALGTDYYITGVPIPGFVSSEVIGISYDVIVPDKYEVWYRDMGESRTLLSTADFSEARERFIKEVVELASGRGRGPQARPDVQPGIPLNEVIGRLWQQEHGDEPPRRRRWGRSRG